jgi:hypothetical protein
LEVAKLAKDLFSGTNKVTSNSKEDEEVFFVNDFYITLSKGRTSDLRSSFRNLSLKRDFLSLQYEVFNK